MIESDGSCRRSIRQPTDRFLPPEALTPAWNARWETVFGAASSDAKADPAASLEESYYFVARGVYRSPEEIPAHFRYEDDKFPEVGASEIQRTYRSVDYGFVVEHRWQEKVTNIVTIGGFLAARDELLDLLVSLLVDEVGKRLGAAYDVSRLQNYIRNDGRTAVEQLTVALYESAGRNLGYEELKGLLSKVVARHGLDLLDSKGDVVSEEEIDRRCERFLRQLLARHLRHRDGSRLTGEELRKVIREETSSEVWSKSQEEFEERIGPVVLRMTGHYHGPLAFLFEGGPPRFEFGLQLPGRLIETNGRLAAENRVSWRFTGNEMYPDGYTMRARSIVLDIDGQKKILGRAVITDRAKALAFIDLVGDEGPLLEAVQRVKKTGKVEPLDEVNPRSAGEEQRAARLREMLLPK